jgi:hypothetical protein
MPALQVVASRALAGKTTVAVALGQGMASAGAAVRLERVGAGAPAEADAATFAGCLFAASSGAPVAAGAVKAPAEGILIVEGEAGEALAGLPAVLVVHAAPSEADVAQAAKLGGALVGSIATAVHPGRVDAIAREMTDAGLRPLGLLPEDRTLAGPSVDDIRAALRAEVLYDAGNGAEGVRDVVVAPVYTDPARPHFARYESKAILTPFNKTDLQLAAVESGAACLVITGGGRPSPYVLDRVQHDAVTVLVAPGGTVASVAALSGVWGASRFSGEAKAAAAAALLASRLDLAAFLKRLG